MSNQKGYKHTPGCDGQTEEQAKMKPDTKRRSGGRNGPVLEALENRATTHRYTDGDSGMKIVLHKIRGEDGVVSVYCGPESLSVATERPAPADKKRNRESLHVFKAAS